MESLRNLAELFTTLPTIAMASGGGSGLGRRRRLWRHDRTISCFAAGYGPVPFMCTQIYRGAGRNLLR